MLMAQLKGKLTREEENMEDLLTSNIFGSFKYVPPEEGLVPFLARAVQVDGRRPLEDLSSVKSCNYIFWPNYVTIDQKGCEPDLLITIDDSSIGRLFIMIEAKYRSPKSSFPSVDAELTDQLAKEWDVLQNIAGNRGQAFLVFATADYTIPQAAIEESQLELKQKRGERGNIIWLSWRELPSILVNTGHPILEDLYHLLHRHDMYYFRGINLRKNTVSVILWAFVSRLVRFEWGCEKKEILWNFSPQKQFWPEFHCHKIEWRFRV